MKRKRKLCEFKWLKEKGEEEEKFEEEEKEEDKKKLIRVLVIKE